jgi:hypothetical protein
LRRVQWQRDVPQTCIGIHVGKSVIFDGPAANKLAIASHAADMFSRLMSLAGDAERG